MPGSTITFGYTNHRGEFAVRQATPERLWEGISPYHAHEGEQIFMRAYDLKHGAVRDFALKDCDFTVAALPAGLEPLQFLIEQQLARNGIAIRSRDLIGVNTLEELGASSYILRLCLTLLDPAQPAVEAFRLEHAEAEVQRLLEQVRVAGLKDAAPDFPDVESDAIKLERAMRVVDAAREALVYLNASMDVASYRQREVVGFARDHLIEVKDDIDALTPEREAEAPS